MPTDPTRAKAIFLEAADLPDAARAAYLDRACEGDAGLRGRVEVLLRAHDPDGSFLGTPAAVVPDPDHAATRAFSPDADHAATRTGGGTGPADDEIPLGFLAPATRPDSLGRIGHYEVLQVLGQGGFGIVFRAFDDVLHRVVAVKVLAPHMAATSPARKRFLREARTSGAIRHEHVVQVHEVGEEPLPYLVMEFIPGETLQQRLDRIGPIEPAEVVRIGRQIAEGLAAAHATDLIHRDIKPGNILLEGSQQKVKITDFGLARAADDASISQSGIIAGTPMYMAPEQALGHKLDQRADLFSLGSVLYQMASGRPPFRANGTVAVLKRVAEDTPRDIREIVPEVPPWLCNIIAKLHEKKPDDRFQTAREIADVLADCDQQLKAHGALKDFSRIPGGKPRRPRRRRMAAAAGVLLLPVIALAVTESAGVTHLLRGQPTSNGPIKSGEDSTPVVAKGTPDGDGWVQLFNGKDFEGLSFTGPENWKVQDKVLVGTSPNGRWSNIHISTQRADFQNFHLRFEFKFNKPVRPGYYDITPAGPAAKVTNRWIRFYVPEFDSTSQLGSQIIPADTWFQQELIREGSNTTMRINGLPIVEVSRAVELDYASLRPGSVGLQASRNIEVQIRKFEIKELPASPPTLPKTASEPLPPTFKNGIGMEFVKVPKGKSWLGGGKDRPGDREVEIPADFYLGKYEVTQEEWEKVMYENPSHFSRNGAGKDAVKDIPDADLKRFPVEMVSYQECQLFVAMLNKREKETGWVYRLPTEMEREYACRGGPMADKLDSAFDFYFAKPTNTLSLERANFGGEKGLRRTCKVGSYEPNRLGLYDLYGNVGEWCVWEYDLGPPPRLAVCRGGSWSSSHYNCTAAGDGDRSSGVRWNHRGLRLARVPAGGPKTPPVALAPFTDADVKRIAALPAEQQVEEVRKELVRRNPGFDGKLETKIEDGVVTKLRINADRVTDISPIRVFNALRVLDLSGTLTNGRPNSLLADLTPLEGMKLAGLTHLSLDCTKVADAGMIYFKDCKDLQFLNLSWTEVTDKGLAHFKDCKSLTELWLINPRISDAGLAFFKDCKNLTYLNVGEARVGDGGLNQIKDYKALTRLYLQGTVVSDAGLTHLGGMSLRALWIDRTAVTDLTPLQGMPLEAIRLTPKKITKGLDILRDMKSLKTIGISWDQSWPAAEFWERYDKGEFGKAFTDADVKRIAALPAEQQVEEVRKELVRRNPGFDGKVETKIEDGVVTEFRIVPDTVTDIAPIRVFDALKVLDCQGTYTDKANGLLADLSPLGGMSLTGLTHLNLGRTKVTDAEMAYFKDCKNLSELHVSNTRLTDAGLGHFKDCKNLTCLNLGDTRVSDAGLIPFKGCKSLTSVFLPDTHVGNAGLAHLRGLPLTALWIDNTDITDLTPLQGMPLEDIHLTPKSVTRGLDVLRDMKGLKTIGIRLNQSWPAAEFWERYDKGEFAAVMSPDRRAAEYVLATGGTLNLNGEGRQIKAADDQPRESFRLTPVAFRDINWVTVARLAGFAGCNDVTHLDRFGTPVGDAGLADSASQNPRSPARLR